MMYWLESTLKDYEDLTSVAYSSIEEALVDYDLIIKIMMRTLPEDKWFNLRVMREPEPTDFMPNRNQVVRSWVY